MKIRSFEELMRDGDIPPEEMVLEPWLPTNGLAMIAGQTGLGKTMVAMGIALAIGSATQVLGWNAPAERRVLYVDGEMALQDMQERVRSLVKGHPEFEPGLKNVFLLSHADQDKGIPNLIEYRAARREIERLMEELDCQVLELDNLSALCNSAAENDVESWTVMQDWLLHLRRKGYTVIFLHHTGKPNEETGYVKQRGTSKREDVLNTTMVLRHEKGQDAGFRILFTKHRGFLPQHDMFARLSGIDEGFCRIETVDEKKGRKLEAGKFSKELG